MTAPSAMHLAALALPLLAPPVAAAEAVTATYVFRWGGIEVGELEATLREDGGAEAGGYRVSWRGRTTGLAGALFPFTGEGESVGRRESGRYRSGVYAVRSRRGGGAVAAWRVGFAPDGRAARVEVPPEQLAGREPVPEALRVGPDPAALALAAIAGAAPGARLDGASFNGKRAARFALACADAPEPGAALLPCTVQGRLVAGAARDHPPDPPGEPVRVWLRPGAPRPGSGGGPGGGWWPVRAEASTRFGAVEVRLVGTGPGPHIGG